MDHWTGISLGWGWLREPKARYANVGNCMKHFTIIGALSIVINTVWLAPAHSEEAPVKILHNMGIYYIQSTVDVVTIQGIRANRGNCSMGTPPGTVLPRTLRFGEIVQAYVNPDPPCSVLEIEIYTDQGEWDFRADQ